MHEPRFFVQMNRGFALMIGEEEEFFQFGHRRGARQHCGQEELPCFAAARGFEDAHFGEFPCAIAHWHQRASADDPQPVGLHKQDRPAGGDDEVVGIFEDVAVMRFEREHRCDPFDIDVVEVVREVGAVVDDAKASHRAVFAQRKRPVMLEQDEAFSLHLTASEALPEHIIFSATLPLPQQPNP
jgi:hypothetical protein